MSAEEAGRERGRQGDARPVSDGRAEKGWAGGTGPGSGGGNGSKSSEAGQAGKPALGRRRGGNAAGPQRIGKARGSAGTKDRASSPAQDWGSAPGIPDDVRGDELDPAVRRDLRTLSKGNADIVGRHLVMVGSLVDTDVQEALEHARAARSRAGRVAVVRETAGIAAYHAGEWAEALGELRAARRMAGGPGLIAVMADCERGLGRPERAIELGRSVEARSLDGVDAIELKIVVGGARMDLGRYDAAVVTLQAGGLDPAKAGSADARLFYAYAEALAGAGRVRESLEWFRNAAASDADGETDADERAVRLSSDEQAAGR